MRARTALIAAALAVSCGGTPGYRERAAALSKSGDLEAAIEELRVGLAEHPRDAEAHAALAHLQDRAGRPGAALRHFERAARYGDLSRDDRHRLAALHVERARARLALGDGDAWRDLDAANHLADIDDALWADAYRAGALAALRQGSGAESLLRKLADIDPNDPRLAALEPDAADVATLGAAAHWAWDGGAKRAGHDLLATYVDRGGRAPDLVRRWIEARLWWRGAEADLSPEIVDTWIRGGGDACLAAYAPSDYGCESLARPTPALWARARRLHWRTANPHLAGVFVSLALRAWATEGGESWLARAARLVDIDAMSDPKAWPLYAAATLHRLRGDPPQGLDDAIAAAAGMAPHERAVVFAEAAVEGRELSDLAVAGELPDYAWIPAAAAARAAGDDALELERLQQAGPHVFRYLAGQGDLARLVDEFGTRRQAYRYRAALARWNGAMGVADPPAAPFGTPDPAAISDDPELADVAAAYRRDPALALRRADRYISEKIAAGARAPAVIELLIRLGEPKHALEHAIALAEDSPHHAPYLMVAGTAAAATGDIDLAEVYFIAAAAQSGDPGATSLAAARVYARFHHPIACIAAGRRALENTAPGEEQEVLLALFQAMTAAGRADDAASVMARYRERTPGYAPDTPRAHELPDPAWHFGDAAAHANQAGELLAIALTSDGAARAAALQLLEHVENLAGAAAAEAAIP